MPLIRVRLECYKWNYLFSEFGELARNILGRL